MRRLAGHTHGERKGRGDMKGHAPEVIPNTTTRLRRAQRCLLRDAAAVLRLRRERGVGDSCLSPTAADELASVFEAIANDHPALERVDRKEAIALAHRLIDDDHPEHSRMWPRKAATP